MVERRVAEAAEAMEGAVIAGDPDQMWRGAALDSRRVAGGELFFALPGERTDGHRFAGAALAAGAAAAVVARPVEAPEGSALVRVADTGAALHALTRAVRREVPRRLVGVTGSVGKTTVKELLAALLATRFRVAKTPGNLNTLYGFPVALLGIPEDTEWMVAELAMSTPGELAALSRLARPDAALLLNVRPVHLEFFGTLRAIAEAKGEILAGLAPDALLVANADDPEVVRLAARHRGRSVTFGIREPAEVWARDLAPAPAGEVGSRFTLAAGGREQPIELPLHGLYNAENCLAAAACAWALGVDLPAIAAGVRGARPAAMRGVVRRARGAVIVDDAYNSNPDALARALEAAAGIAARRRWAVLGDMLELGPEAPAFHRAAGAQAARLGLSPLLAVGESAREMAAGAEAEGAEARWFADAAAAAPAAARELRAGDAVLVKGSRGVGLEAVVRALLGEER